MSNVRRFWVVAVACAGLALVAPHRADAQLSAVANSNAGSTCTGANNGSGFCGSSVAFPVPNSGTNFQSRYAWNINADVGIASTRDTSGTAVHGLTFTATAPAPTG